MSGVMPPNGRMALNRTRSTIWLLLTGGYLLLTGLVIIYVVSCEEMFCQLIIALPGLPWTFLLSRAMEIDSFSTAGWAVTIAASVLLNVSILYALLGVGSRREGPGIS